MPRASCQALSGLITEKACSPTRVMHRLIVRGITAREGDELRRFAPAWEDYLRRLLLFRPKRRTCTAFKVFVFPTAEGG